MFYNEKRDNFFLIRKFNDKTYGRQIETYFYVPGDRQVALDIMHFRNATIVHFKRLGSRGFHAFFNHYLCFF